jgi:DNA-binding HxlR family transcriptional regulator
MNGPRSGCPINAAVEVLGDKWSLIVLRDIMFADRRNFRVLQRECPEGIASNILAARLRDLVANGMLTRDDASAGHRATYSLTQASIDLVPIFAELGLWSARNRSTDTGMRAKAELLHRGGSTMWHTFMRELRQLHLDIPNPTPHHATVLEQLNAEEARVRAQSEHSEPTPAR